MSPGWYICMLFVVCWFFFKITYFWKILSELPSECQTDWIQIRSDVLSGLIWVQTVCKGYQQTTLWGKELTKRWQLGCLHCTNMCKLTPKRWQLSCFHCKNMCKLTPKRWQLSWTTFLLKQLVDNISPVINVLCISTYYCSSYAPNRYNLIDKSF